ncbi:hypothetical protein OIU77_017902 [Salix suchowensis]|uniref:DYW domain-containing protein n=1 Tax=Salix suchowensis TaxID=1278906 RepID=A0ABQ8ZR18_9ROSI|nr:hypothetical protein OIU77_017902 [Salix suchowensis]
MLRSDTEPNEFTFATVLTSCTGVLGFELGRQIHSLIIKRNYESHIFVGSSLLDMYAKAGGIHEAQGIFECLSERDVVSCTAIISGYAQLGLDEEALQLFRRFQREGMSSNYVTYASLLTALSGLAALDHGKQVHGHVLRCCRLLEIEPENAGNYVILSNLYASAGRWEDVRNVRELMMEKAVIKEPGRSWIELDQTLHTFYASDRSHPRREEVFLKARELLVKFKESGYVPDQSCVLYDVDEEQKEKILLGHSEKLALAFGLISTSEGVPLRVIKNLRICVDCHNFAKFVSKVYGRRVSIRDKNRFHHIAGGICSCGDYW